MTMKRIIDRYPLSLSTPSFFLSGSFPSPPSIPSSPLSFQALPIFPGYIQRYLSSTSYPERVPRICCSSLHPGILLHLILILLQLVTCVLGAKVQEVIVPQPGVVGQPAELECVWTSDENDFYSVRWYKNNEQFYSFIKGNNPEKVDHKLQEVGVSLTHSDKRVVTISHLTSAAEGTYRCEVMSEAPVFEISFSATNLTVVSMPNDPEIQMIQSRYKEGETLYATCTARHARPPASLTFYVNGVPIHPDSHRVQNLGVSSEEGTDYHPKGVFTSTSRLVLSLSSNHIPNFRLGCHALVETLEKENTITVRVDPPRTTMFSFFNAGIACCLPMPLLLVVATVILLLLQSPW